MNVIGEANAKWWPEPKVVLRCGKMMNTGGLLTALPKKGQLEVQCNGVCYRVNWFCTQDGTLETIVMGPEDMATLSMMNQPGARCAVLKGNHRECLRPGQSHYFWLLSKDTAKDEEIIKEANLILSGDHELILQAKREHAHKSANATQSPQASPPASSDRLQNLGQGRPDTSTRPLGDNSRAMPALTPEYLATILGDLASSHERLPSLAKILQAENVVPLLRNEEVQSRLHELVEHLPEAHQDDARNNVGAAIEETIRSAQMQNQIRSISHGLESTELDVTQLGLEFQGYSAADFLESVQKAARRSKKEQEEVASPAHRRQKREE